MKLRNYVLCVLMCMVMMFTGCITMQIKGDGETLAAPDLIIGMAGTIIKAKYPEKAAKLLNICEDIITTDVNKEIETRFNDLLNALTNDIKDPEVRAIAQALLASFDFKVDTGIDYDFGARRTAVTLAQTLKKVLGG